MGKTTRHELSLIEKGMVIVLLWFFAKSLLLVSLQDALGRPLKPSFSRLQNAAMSLELGDPKILLNANGGLSGERLRVTESLFESNYVTSLHLMCR